MLAKLTDICDIQYGYAFDSAQFSETEGIPLVRIRDVVRGFSETYTTESFPEEYLVHDGDILIGMDGEFNIARWHGGTAALNQRVCRLIPQRVNSEYIFHFMPSALKAIEEKTPFVTVKHLSAKELNKIAVPIPIIDEQVRIGNTLNEVRGIIETRQRQLLALDTLIKARFVEMFGDPKLNPHGYPVHQLSDHIQFLTSGSRGWAQYCVDDGDEWFITIKNVKDCHVSTKDMQAINAPENAEAKRTRVQEGDLLISITADLGRTGVVTQEIAEHGAYINQHLTCIRLDREVLEPLYVAYFMESAAGKEQFISKNQSAVKAGLNFNSINTLRLLVPPIKVQQQFLCFVSQVDKSKSVVQKALDEAQLLFDRLMQQYFG